MNRNREETGITAGLVLIMLGAVLLAVPLIGQLDVLAGGYGLACLGAFSGLLGLATVFVYAVRAAAMRRALPGKDLLARWTCSPELLAASARADYLARRGENAGLFAVAAAVVLVVSAVLAIGDYSVAGQVNLWFLASMLGLLAFLAVLAFWLPALAYRRARRTSQQVLILAEGVFIHGAYHAWGKNGIRLIKAMVHTGQLEFTLRSPSRLGLFRYPTYTLVVPVPPGEEAAAQQVVDRLSGD